MQWAHSTPHTTYCCKESVSTDTASMDTWTPTLAIYWCGGGAETCWGYLSVSEIQGDFIRMPESTGAATGAAVDAAVRGAAPSAAASFVAGALAGRATLAVAAAARPPPRPAEAPPLLAATSLLDGPARGGAAPEARAACAGTRGCVRDGA